MGGMELLEMQIYPLACNLQTHKAVDLLNMFLQFLQDKGEKEKAHKYRLCILLLVTGIFY